MGTRGDERDVPPEVDEVTSDPGATPEPEAPPPSEPDPLDEAFRGGQ
jgi:hypothetical protein